MTWSLVLLVNAAYFALGLGILLHFGARTRVAWPASLFVGITAWTIVTLLFAYARIPLPVWAVFPSAAGILVFSRRFRMAVAAVTAGDWRDVGRARLAVRSPNVLATSALAFAGCALAVLIIRSAPNRPIREWDSWSFWIPKAQALASPQGIESAVLRAPGYGHLDYPLFVPALWSNSRGLDGAWSTPATQVQMALLLIAFFGVGFTCLRALSPAWVATAGALILFGIRPLGETVLSLYADVPLAIAACVLVVATIAWHRGGDRSYLLIAALAAVMLTTSKSEGLLLWVSVLVPFLALLVADRDRRWLPWLGVMAAGACSWVLWRLVIADVPVEADYDFRRLLSPGDLAGRTDRMSTAATELVRVAAEPQLVLLVLAGALGIMIALLSGEWRIPVAAAAFLLLAWAGLVVVYTISDLPLADYLATSASRVLIAPLLAWAGAGLAAALVGASRLGFFRARTTPAGANPGRGAG